MQKNLKLQKIYNSYKKKLKNKLREKINDYLRRPAYFSHNLFLNKLNFQNLRMDFYNYLHLKKKNTVIINDEVSKELSENGIVIIENIFNENELELIKNKIKELEDKNYFTFDKNKQNSNVDWLHGNINLNLKITKDLYEILDKKFSKYYKYVEQVIRSKITFPPKIIYQKVKLPFEKKDIKDSNACFHADKMIPGIKFFFALEDCNIENGPFGYIVGSHIRTPNRKESDLLNSIKKAQYTKKKKLPDEFFINSMSKMSELEKRDVVCKKNSIILTNIRGYHKRGRLYPGFQRQFLRILFYDYQLSGFKKFLKLGLNYVDLKYKKNKFDNTN